MWILDKHGAAINMDQVMGIFLDPDPDFPSAWEVKANGATNVLVAQFSVDAPVTNPQAEELYERMCDMLGTTDLTQ